MCRSHISLTVQPAPRITKAPAPNKANNLKSGKPPDAIVRPHVDGQKSSHVPEQKRAFIVKIICQ